MALADCDPVINPNFNPDCGATEPGEPAPGQVWPVITGTAAVPGLLCLADYRPLGAGRWQDPTSTGHVVVACGRFDAGDGIDPA